MTCGLSISGKYHVTARGNICDRCWNDPNLFFPEKMKENGTYATITNVFKIADEDKLLDIPVIKLKQKNLVLYTGKIKAKELLHLYGVLSFQEGSLTGYQRELFKTQTEELAKYILECEIPLIPGIFLSIRGGAEFRCINELNSDFGMLQIPATRGALWIIDGQHRIGGFEELLSTLFEIQGDQLESYIDEIFNYDVPITFLDTKNAVLTIRSNSEELLTEPDIERLAFFIINKTQRRLNPSLKDTLQYIISRAGIRGVPSIEREKWRTVAAAIGIDFNSQKGSPWYNYINISGERGLNRPLQLNSFVSSLQPMLKNKYFSSISFKEQKSFILKYWTCIKIINKPAFERETYFNYLILKTLGVYTLNRLALDYINDCKKMNIDFNDLDNILKFIEKLGGFDWGKQSSPIASFGGVKGVREARNVLLNYMSEKND